MVFKSFWYGSRLGTREWLCLRSFTEHGHCVHLYTYDSRLAVPKGVSVKDASAIYPEEDVFFYQDHAGQGGVSAFSNMFRYRLLYENGGWWIDMDVACTGANIPEGERYYGRQGDGKINCAAMKFEKKSPVMEQCLETAERLGSDISWGDAGPRLFTKTLRTLGLADQAAPARYAYPVSWPDAVSFYQPSKTEGIRSSLREQNAPFLHFWNGTLSRAGIQSEIAPPKGSALARIANDLDVHWPCPDVRYSSAAVDRMARNLRRSRKLKAARAKLDRIQDSRPWKVAVTLQRILGGLRLRQE